MPDPTEKENHPIDIHVGRRVRLRRTLLKMSQEVLGDKIGISFQQIQKYERGVNRIGASRLYEIGVALDVPVSFFYDDMGTETRPTVDPDRSVPKDDAAIPADVIHRRDVVTLIRSYDAIPDPSVRQRALELVQALGGEIRQRRKSSDAEDGEPL